MLGVFLWGNFRGFGVFFMVFMGVCGRSRENKVFFGKIGENW